MEPGSVPGGGPLLHRPDPVGAGLWSAVCRTTREEGAEDRQDDCGARMETDLASLAGHGVLRKLVTSHLRESSRSSALTACARRKPSTGRIVLPNYAMMPLQVR